jgi:hypothetical protein
MEKLGTVSNVTTPIVFIWLIEERVISQTFDSSAQKNYFAELRPRVACDSPRLYALMDDFPEAYAEGGVLATDK